MAEKVHVTSIFLLICIDMQMNEWALFGNFLSHIIKSNLMKTQRICNNVHVHNTLLVIVEYNFFRFKLHLYKGMCNFESIFKCKSLMLHLYS